MKTLYRIRDRYNNLFYLDIEEIVKVEPFSDHGEDVVAIGIKSRLWMNEITPETWEKIAKHLNIVGLDTEDTTL